MNKKSQYPPMRYALAVAMSAFTLGALSSQSLSADWPTESLGLGSISLEPVGEQRFNWEDGVSRSSRTPPTPYLTADYQGPVPSNDWATSLVVDRYSKALHAHPLSYKATSEGFEIAMPPEVIGPIDDMGETSVRRNHNGNADLLVNGNRLQSDDARLRDTGDWDYDISMADSDAEMTVTFGHGLPFSYFHFYGTDATLKLVRDNTSYDIIEQSDHALLLRVLDPIDDDYNYYGVYFSDNGTLENSGSPWRIDFQNDQGYLSVAGLPDGDPDTFTQYRNVAYNVVVDTTVNWQYDEVSAELVTTYQVTTENRRESNASGTILSLLPHQWRHSQAAMSLPSYDSVRGEMKTIQGTGFSTRMPFNGILPQLPLPATEQTRNRLTQHLTDYYDYGVSLEPEFIQPGVDGANTGYDTYWLGKNLNRIIGLLNTSDALDDSNPDLTVITEDLYAALKGQLEWWFTADKSTADNYFYYNQEWGTLVGYPASYDTDTDLNDHHFHYGYWINAAAQIALRDPQWADDANWGAMVNELIGDIATTDRHSDRYPFLRNFDIYEGHSWASGVVPYTEDGYYPEGNNNEASSEGINAWAGLILWGEATGDKRIRDLGIYLYTHEVEAANSYWFNLYGDVDHPQYPNSEISRVWGGGYDHTTWWTEDPIQTHGINMLPITGASFYLGQDPEFVQENFDAIWTEYALWDGDEGTFNPAEVNDRWQDIINEYLAFADPDAAIDNWKDVNDWEDPINGVDPALGIEFGESRAHTYQHLQMLKQYGLPDFTVRPVQHSLGVVLNKDGVRTYVGYNPTSEPKTLKFSDAMGLIDVPAGSLAVGTGEPVVIDFDDADDDGVYDALDYCPDTPSGEAVNDAGCPDTDGDQVFDNNDSCPATDPTAVVNAAGCPDTDGDNVFDDIDQCPDTPAMTTVDDWGCEILDDDGDGVANGTDQCPETPAGNPVNAMGCTDSDGDSIDDSQDQCPMTETGQQVNADGCPDDDGDGVENASDLCPDSVGGASVNASGCGDTDQDGVDNSVDQCPATPAGVDVDANGCVLLPYGMESHADGQAFLYMNTKDWADAHYRINDGSMMNVRMIQTGQRNQWSLSGLSEGDTVAVSFTYLDAVCACVQDTETLTLVYQGTTSSDEDGDGVSDSQDQCPGTEPGTSVDAQGCEITAPVDSDGDGVTDDLDQCAGTPAGKSVDAQGCEIVGVNFGVTDPVAQQVTVFLTPADWADLHYILNGGAQQNVRMMKPDSRDNEWDIASVSAGDTLRFWFTYLDPDCDCVKDSMHMEVVLGVAEEDSDGDGVANADDQCPGTRSGAQVDSNGCELTQTDGDQDGVLDADDQCPDTPPGVPVDANGCELTSADHIGAQVTADGNVLFWVNTASWADVHFWVNDGTQQNVRMVQTGTRNEWTLAGLNSGDEVAYQMTYWDDACNCAKDSQAASIVLP